MILNYLLCHYIGDVKKMGIKCVFYRKIYLKNYFTNDFYIFVRGCASNVAV